MEALSLGVPRPILDALPEDGVDASSDMQRVVASWQERINESIERAPDDREAVAAVADAIEELESRRDRYDEFVVELRAWGQSPIYAIAWRNLYMDLLAQIYEHETLGAELERERNVRLVEDGIRLGEQ
ncbi:Uncharacterized protein HSRCO_2595 [Halanaeroarchaeum sp. HSR-CO]|uniref:hypothetical protein n=1 Tax=Halanaeroarchaeum sp. HSR-CO TaxID=2866382 RepID=UPI00217DC5E7|nr:hypothetical protein [Halanaeroarchaeum sp. HSR-CO]UWG48857.1 Uncharacterized protein HSRCO_2595 [Halanaeroarchaeum sp. HSR-CO]